MRWKNTSRGEGMAVSRSMLVKYIADVSNYQKGMKEIAQSTQQSKKEMQLWAAQNNVSSNSSKYLKKELDLTKTTYANFGKQIKDTEAVLQKAKTTYGENSTQAKKYSDKLMELQIKHAQLGNKIKEAEDPLKRFQGTLEKTGSIASKAGSFLTRYISVPALAAGAGLFKLTLGAAEYGDSLSEMSKKTGLSVKSLQEWRYAASQLDYDYESLQTTITGFTNKLRGATDGTGDTAKAMKVLKINMDNGKGGFKSINDIMMESIDKLSGVQDETMRNTLASALFGKSFGELLPLLDAGSGEINKLFGEANKLGYVLGDASVAKLDAFSDRWDALKLRFQVVGAEMGEKFLPLIEGKLMPFIETNLIPGIDSFVKHVGDLIKQFTDLDPKLQKNILAFTGLSLILGPALSGIGNLTTGISELLGFVGKIPGGVSAAATALKGLGVASIGAGGMVTLGAAAIVGGVALSADLVKQYNSNVEKLKAQKQFLDDKAAGKTRPLMEGEKMTGTVLDLKPIDFSKIKVNNTQSEVEKAQAEIDKANKEYSTNMKKYQDEMNKLYKDMFVNTDKASSKIDDFKSSIKSMTEALKQQTTSFANFTGLFDVFERKSVSPERLFNRLKAQVKAMTDWRTALASLEKRGLDATLLNDLRSMGPSAVDSISALSKMSNAQLKQYTGLYNQKFSLAGSEAAKSVSYENQQATKIDKQVNAYFNNAKFTISTNTANELAKMLKLAGVKI